MNINELAMEVHEDAVKHGLWEKPPTLPEALCLIHAELSEALEEYRAKRPMMYFTVEMDDGKGGTYPAIREDIISEEDFTGEKPEGIAVELADVILRTLDLMAALGVDVDAVVMAKHRYNLGREYRHGGKTI